MTDFTTYFPLTGGPKAAEADWGLFAQLWATDGVVRGADSELFVQPDSPASLDIDVLAGAVWVQGFYGRIGTTTTFTVTPDVSNPRIDIVVARLNFATHKIELLYRAGVAAGSPSAPTPTRVAGVTHDIVLAEIPVATGATSITAMTDRRPWSSSGVVRTANLPSASPLVIPNVDQVPQGFIAVVPVTGTTSFDTITAPSAGNPIVILEFAGVLNVALGAGNITLERPISTIAGTLLTLHWTGSTWREIARAREGLAANTFVLGPASGAAGSSVNRFLVQDDFPASLWSNAAPTGLSQAGAVTFVATSGRLLKMGKFFLYQCLLTLTSVGVAGAAFTVTLPFTYTAPIAMTMGTFRYDRVAGGIHAGDVTSTDGTSTITFLVPTLGFVGSNPSFAGAATDKLYFGISGELA